MNYNIIFAGLFLLFSTPTMAQTDTTAIKKERELDNVTITARRATVRTLGGAINGQDILRDEPFKAA